MNYKSKTWVENFCDEPKNYCLLKVIPEFYKDHFNLQGLVEQIPLFKKAYHVVILSTEELDEDDLKLKESCELLYNLVHSRYILTTEGCQDLIVKFEEGCYGYCPRFLCEEQKMLPIGTVSPYVGKTKSFCPRCREVYNPPSKLEEIDGVAFGPSLPEMFLMTYPTLRPKVKKSFSSTLYGFKIHPSVLGEQPIEVTKEMVEVEQRPKKLARRERIMKLWSQLGGFPDANKEEGLLNSTMFTSI